MTHPVHDGSQTFEGRPMTGNIVLSQCDSCGGTLTKDKGLPRFCDTCISTEGLVESFLADETARTAKAEEQAADQALKQARAEVKAAQDKLKELEPAPAKKES